MLQDSEQIDTTFNPGSSVRALAEQTLPAGTYYLRIASNVPTAYTLTLNAYTDTTPPTATLDATDVTTAGATGAVVAVTYSDNQDIDAQTARFSGAINVHAQFNNGSTFDYIVFPDFMLNTDSFPQDAPSYRTLFTFAPHGGALTANDNGLFTVSIRPGDSNNPQVRDVAGNNIPLLTLGTFHIAIGAADTTPPTVASIGASAVTVPGPATYDFTVTYHDNIALNANTLDGSDLRITGPGSFSQLASFISVTPANSVGSNRTATYRITAPGGTWDYTDDGTYSIALQSGQVKDTAGNSAAAGAIGTFAVAVPLPGDATGDKKTNALDFNVLATNFGKSGRGFATGDFNFDGVVNTSDFTLLASKFNQSLPAPLPVERS